MAIFFVTNLFLLQSLALDRSTFVPRKSFFPIETHHMWYRAVARISCMREEEQKNFFPNDKVVNTGLGWGYIVASSGWAGWRAATTLFPKRPRLRHSAGILLGGLGAVKNCGMGSDNLRQFLGFFGEVAPTFFWFQKSGRWQKRGSRSPTYVQWERGDPMHPASAAHEKRKESRWLLSFFGGETHVSEWAFAYTHPAMLHNGEGGRRIEHHLPFSHTYTRKSRRGRGKGKGKQSRNYHGCLSRAASEEKQKHLPISCKFGRKYLGFFLTIIRQKEFFKNSRCCDDHDSAKKLCKWRVAATIGLLLFGQWVCTPSCSMGRGQKSLFLSLWLERARDCKKRIEIKTLSPPLFLPCIVWKGGGEPCTCPLC